jgi:hypothetical protein
VAGAGEELARRQAAAWDEAVRQRLRAAGWKLAGWTIFTAGLALVVHRAAGGQASVGDLVFAVTVAVTGKYGSGKTSMIKLLGKHYRPDSGTIRVDGTDLAARHRDLAGPDQRRLPGLRPVPDPVRTPSGSATCSDWTTGPVSPTRSG